MAKDEEEQDTQKYDFCLQHNLDDGQIIVLRRNMQRHLNQMPEEERVSLKMINKKGDNGIYFTATKKRADKIRERILEHALDWSYCNTNFKLTQLEEEPEGLFSTEDIEELENKIYSSFKEEIGRLNMRMGSQITQLERAQKDVTGLEHKLQDTEIKYTEAKDQLDTVKTELASATHLYRDLKKGTLTEACIRFLSLRNERTDELEMMLTELKESGMDISFITNPPESVERYASDKVTKEMDIEFRDLQKYLEIGKAEDWEKSRLFMPETEMNAAEDKLKKISDLISNADETIKQILEDNLKQVLSTFQSKVTEYTEKMDAYRQARRTYIAYQDAIAKGTEDLAKAKNLKPLLGDLKQIKFPVYALPEQDETTVYLLETKGIAHESFIKAVKTYADTKSEDIMSGKTVLRLTSKGNLSSIAMLKSIKEYYEQNTEAGKMGSKLGLIVQL